MASSMLMRSCVLIERMGLRRYGGVVRGGPSSSPPRTCQHTSEISAGAGCHFCSVKNDQPYRLSVGKDCQARKAPMPPVTTRTVAPAARAPHSKTRSPPVAPRAMRRGRREGGPPRWGPPGREGWSCAAFLGPFRALTAVDLTEADGWGDGADARAEIPTSATVCGPTEPPGGAPMNGSRTTPVHRANSVGGHSDVAHRRRQSTTSGRRPHRTAGRIAA